VDNDLSPLADTEVHYFGSARAEAEFKIFVGHCGTLPRAPAASPAVLYLTDANGYFALAVDLIRSMQLRRHLPPLLVVGIGYRAGSIAETIPVRTRDLTPTSDRETFPGEFHITAAPLILSRGLRYAFGAPH
jgi:predicted alpha/beta superfamily hydrolase